MTRHKPLDITVVIPTIQPRQVGTDGGTVDSLLEQAIKSVQRQRMPPKDLLVVRDSHKQGAAVTRGTGVAAVKTEWTAFLDDDDLMLPWHLEALAAAQVLTEADYVFSYFTVMDKFDQLHPEVDPLGHFGLVFDPVSPTQTTITMLVRSELAKAHPFHDPQDLMPVGANGERMTVGEDYQFTLDCVTAGAKIVHVPMRTWLWRMHGKNTSGRPEAW